MELVSFAEELLGSDSRDEQLIGARILCQFAASDEFGRDTLRKIGTSAATMERLVEMLNWKSPSEAELRQHAAELVSKLASKKQNVLRVAGIPGSMESITSLLHNGRSSSTSMVPRPQEVRISGGTVGHPDHGEHHYDYMRFNLLGLSILKKLAHNHDNCGKIGNTRDLLPTIIKFTAAEGWLLLPARSDISEKEARVKAAKRSLQLLRMLANASGGTGKLLRREIADIVFTVGNMRDIVRHGGEHKLLQKLAVEILTCLSLDTEARGRIGATGGVVRDLFQVFFAIEGGCTDLQQRDLGLEAGEALAMLALESHENCRRMLRLGVAGRLAGALRKPDIRVSAGRILTNLYAYGGSETVRLLRGITEAAAPTVLKAIMTDEKKPLEVSAGLALQIFRPMSREETKEAFRKAGINQTDLAERLIRILQSYSKPSVKEPRIRKYIVELAIWMMQSLDDEEASMIAAFKTGGVEGHLRNVAETTTELELYNVFSGSAGLSRHETTIESLVDTALALLSI